MGGGEKDCKKSGPMDGCGESRMLWSERRELSK